jgi:hypothetical protein
LRANQLTCNFTELILSNQTLPANS